MRMTALDKVVADLQFQNLKAVFQHELDARADEVSVELLQRALGAGTLGEILFAALRQQLERISEVKTYLANMEGPQLDPRRLLAALGYGWGAGTKDYYVDDMPNCDAGLIPVYVFKPDAGLDGEERPDYLAHAIIERSYERLGLKPVDPCRLAAVCAMHPTFGGATTYWQRNGRWRQASCWLSGNKPYIEVNDGSSSWGSGRCFAGVRKQARDQ